MSAVNHQMPENRRKKRIGFPHSASLRLILGFGVLLIVFTAALLTNLHSFAALEKATGEVLVRQHIRTETRQIANACRQMHLAMGRFLRSELPQDLYLSVIDRHEKEIKDSFRTLYNRPVDDRERHHIYRLTAKARALAETLRSDVVPMKVRLQQGEAQPEQLAQIAAQADQFMRDITYAGDRLVLFMDLKVYHVETEANLAWQVNQSVARVTLGVALLLSALTILLTHRAIMKPIRQIVAGTKVLAGGDLSRQIEAPAMVEFRELAESFNRMTDALRIHQKQLIETEKLATIGRFAAGVAHEINNPIAVILGYAKTMLAHQNPSLPVREGLEAVAEEADHCGKIVASLLELSRSATAIEGAVVDVLHVVEETLELAHVLRMVKGAAVEIDVTDDPVPLNLTRVQLRQVILNFVTNALDALRDVPEARLRVRGRIEQQTPAQPALGAPAEGPRPTLVLQFSDNGPGIPEDVMGKLFDPFFTTKSDGTGLGLAITYGIIDAHGGSIDVESVENQGTTFTVRIPVRPEASESEA